MRTRTLAFLCLLFILFQSILLMIRGGDSFAEVPASSVFHDGGEKVVLIRGQVYKKAYTSNIQILYLKNNSVNDSNLLVYDTDFIDIPIGKYITIKGTLGFFERARNPGNFDQALFYARQNIYGVVWCKELMEITGATNKLMDGLHQLKMRWKEKLLECIGEKNGGILSAMLLGEKAQMDESIKELYQNTGISHILAISGLHISFIGLGVYRGIRKTGLGFLASGIVAVGILTLYVFMIGFSVSAFRAYFMLLMRIGADITGRVYDLITATMLGAAITVAFQPLYLTDAGFYMSYGAILGIALILPCLESCFLCKRKIFSSLYTSIAIQLMLFPLTLWFYFVFPTYSCLTNLLVIPLTGTVLGVGILGSVMFVLIPKVGTWCIYFCGLILTYYEKVCMVFSKLPWARLVIGKPDIWQIVLYYFVLLFLVMFVCKTKKIRYSWLGLLIVVVLISYSPKGTLDITMLDVGQGEGIYLSGPNGVNYFIDGGSSDVNQVGKYRIEPFLESQGVGILDYVFITHGDRDHYSGIEEMIGRQDVGVRVKNLVLPANYNRDDELMKLAHKAQKADIRVLVIQGGQSLEEGELQITCLGPAAEDDELEGNAGSMVLEVTYDAFSMLLTGDVEGEGEERLLDRVKGKDYDVLKVAHHGSKYSTSEIFLDEISPKIALISAGKKNGYGHPHEELLERLYKAGCHIITTIENGAIMLQTDGISLTF